MINFGIGSDPEVFGIDERTNLLVSSIGIINGFQKVQLPVTGGGIQEDNVAFEFNPKAAYNKEQFILNTQTCLNSLRDFLKLKDISLIQDISLTFPNSLLLDERAREAGCEPEMCAYSFSQIDPPTLTNIRAVGGHVQVSWGCGDDIYERVNLVRCLDACLTIPLLPFEPSNCRRGYYGMAGSHRPKFTSLNDDFDGIEYRVLSNFWIWREEYMSFIFDTVQWALENKDEVVRKTLGLEETIKTYINKYHQDSTLKGNSSFLNYDAIELIHSINPHIDQLSNIIF